MDDDEIYMQILELETRVEKLEEMFGTSTGLTVLLYRIVRHLDNQLVQSLLSQTLENMCKDFLFQIDCLTPICFDVSMAHQQRCYQCHEQKWSQSQVTPIK